MSEWITNRLPAPSDATIFDCAKVWVMVGSNVRLIPYHHVDKGQAWQPIEIPHPYMEPYVAPKRWQMEWDSQYHQWLVRDAEGHIGAVLCSDSPSPEKYRGAAERIAAIYNEVMP